jgi:hypothetical protein
MKFSHFIIIAVTLPAVLHSCSKPVPKDDQDALPLTWKVQVEDTKSATSLNTEALKTTPFGVTAYLTDKGTPYAGPSTGYPYLDNRKVVYNSTENYWECDPKAWWVLGKQISFFAYAPWTDDENVFKFVDPIDNRSLLRGEFTQDDNPANQTDLLVSIPALDQVVASSPASVPLRFKHSLSKVLVYLNITGETESHKFKLDHMTLSGVAGSGKFNYDTSAGGFIWDEIHRSDATVRDKTYDLSISAGTLEDVFLKHVDDLTTETGLDRFVKVQTAPQGELMILPQPLTALTKLTMDLDSYKEDPMSPGNWIKDKDELPLDILLPAENSWEAGNVYCYTITLDITHLYIIQFGITIVPWGNYSQTIEYP